MKKIFLIFFLFLLISSVNAQYFNTFIQNVTGNLDARGDLDNPTCAFNCTLGLYDVTLGDRYGTFTSINVTTFLGFTPTALEWKNVPDGYKTSPSYWEMFFYDESNNRLPLLSWSSSFVDDYCGNTSTAQIFNFSFANFTQIRNSERFDFKFYWRDCYPTTTSPSPRQSMDIGLLNFSGTQIDNELPEFNVTIDTDYCYNRSNNLDNIVINVDIETYDPEGDTIYYSVGSNKLVNITHYYDYTLNWEWLTDVWVQPDDIVIEKKFTYPYLTTCTLNRYGDEGFTYNTFVNNEYWIMLQNCTGTDKSLYFKEDISGSYPSFMFNLQSIDKLDSVDVAVLDWEMNDKLFFNIKRPDDYTFVISDYNETQITNFSMNKNDNFQIRIYPNYSNNIEYKVQFSNVSNTVATITIPILNEKDFNGILKLEINESTTVFNSYMAVAWFSDDLGEWSTSYDSEVTTEQKPFYTYYIKVSDDKHYTYTYNDIVKELVLIDCRYHSDIDVDQTHFNEDFNIFVLVNFIKIPFTSYINSMDEFNMADIILGTIIFIVFFIVLILLRDFSTTLIVVGFSGSVISYLAGLYLFPVYLIIMSFGLAIYVMRSFNG